MSRRGWIAQIASLLSALGLGGGFAMQTFETRAESQICRALQESYAELVQQVASHSLGHP